VSITIADYDERWPAQFSGLQRELRSALGDVAIAIEHVGSTAVSGLAAKPVIDIDVVIASSDELPVVIERLARIGYEHEGDLGIGGRHAFKSPKANPPRHVYVCFRGATALREHLAFRDYLQSNLQAADAYASLKRELAGTVGDDRAEYTAGKTNFVRDVLSRCQGASGDSIE
jgi:GrpB-like predicted nucleotidyltransferase (UPF0157 family)